MRRKKRDASRGSPRFLTAPRTLVRNDNAKMNESLWSFWNTAQPALAGLKAGEWAVLLVLGASLLVLSALRERYLLVWTAGWALLAGSRLAGVHGAGMGIPERYVPAVEQAAFAVAMGLFAGAVFLYVRERN